MTRILVIAGALAAAMLLGGWGFDRQALFVTKMTRRSEMATARLTLRGQACTETICKNIDVAISLPLANAKTDASPSDLDWKSLVQVASR